MSKLKMDFSFLENSFNDLNDKVIDVDLNNVTISSTTDTPLRAQAILNVFSDANKMLNDKILNDISSMKQIGYNYELLDKYLSSSASSLGIDITAVKLCNQEKEETSEEVSNYYSNITIPSGGKGYNANINDYECKIIVDGTVYSVYLNCEGHEDDYDEYTKGALHEIVNVIAGGMGYTFSDEEIYSYVPKICKIEAVDGSCYKLSIDSSNFIIKAGLKAFNLNFDDVFESVTDTYAVEMKE